MAEAHTAERPEASEKRELPLSERTALRIEEAAALVGLSERAFRDHILSDPACPRFFAGKSVRLPRRLFEAYIEARSCRDSGIE